MFQDFIRYQYSIKDNISIGNWGKHHDDFYKSNRNIFSKFILDLPEGYDTIMGQLESGAHDISGGEWQKIAICRTLAKDGAEYLNELCDAFIVCLRPLKFGGFAGKEFLYFDALNHAYLCEELAEKINRLKAELAGLNYHPLKWVGSHINALPTESRVIKDQSL